MIGAQMVFVRSALTENAAPLPPTLVFRNLRSTNVVFVKSLAGFVFNCALAACQMPFVIIGMLNDPLPLTTQSLSVSPFTSMAVGFLSNFSSQQSESNSG